MINQYQKKYKEETLEKTHAPVNKPKMYKIKIPLGKNFADVNKLMREQGLHTVCEEARCPNKSECWSHRTATFLILGDICTRSCGFCNIKTGKPKGLDLDEPRRVAEAVYNLHLKHVVITSVDRDDLEDGGASIYSETIKLIREKLPNCTIEILIPDFKGDEKAFEIIMKNPPDILNHNLETVNRMYPVVRPQAKYQRSLNLLKWFKDKGLITKSGIMVGIGESKEEIFELMKDLRDVNCDIMTIGQYLQPSKEHLQVHRYVEIEEFKEYEIYGKELGFKDVFSGPFVRSSYHAERHAELVSVNTKNN
ncbi:MAG TPA: lipoyl synthase [Ignavibacteriales bacterium]|nr:lipoyl synthase [Ignavibacteriales bacterium]HOL81485.1 lipoyl synthase [Ignavibacteriales bacterium]HOM65383.1 lipoyl synthase [Ignavibacteriales bacterium]HPD67012.1 lipoyl synthase [Ignavibacteriales bacterium]HPP33588.1 lipoyl synthase [Ignavibacteriales bacterium]